jgi:UDPglucose 6-dehydrogenase
LFIHDPKVNLSQIEKDLGDFTTNQDEIIDSKMKKPYIGKWEFSNNMEKVFEGSDAVVVLTDWPQYYELKWENIVSEMRAPAWVFDTRSILNSDSVINSGINYWRLGDGSNM